jgi:hypothetical protein
MKTQNLSISKKKYSKSKDASSRPALRQRAVKEPPAEPNGGMPPDHVRDLIA